jgi:hypothetical protein
MRRLAAGRILLAAALSGCSRAPAGGAPIVDAALAEASPTAAAPAPAAIEAGEPALSRPLSPPPQSGEAVRFTVPRLDADVLLRAHLAVLQQHFGADAAGPFEVQRTGLAGGATAFLVSRPHEGDPFVLVVDRDALLWTKQRPVAGILAPVRHPALVPRPDGGAAIFAWVEALGTVAARMWADDSNPFGEFEVFSPDRCDDLSAAYERGFGWIVVCSSPAGARAALMREDGTMTWGRHGLPVGAPSAVGPTTVAFDTSASFLLLQRAASAGGERVLAYRFDGAGHELWAAPVDLAVLGLAADPDERIRATSLEEHGVRAEPLRSKALRGKACDIGPDGKVTVAPVGH